MVVIYGCNQVQRRVDDFRRVMKNSDDLSSCDIDSTGKILVASYNTDCRAAYLSDETSKQESMSIARSRRMRENNQYELLVDIVTSCTL